ncbi:VRR-NUC domain-containing protein [Vibrio parahaemolyticus]|nr:VRR-NUC domain-containing protein [Vibrio parahaemolyticus]EHA6974710.1 VRR-NUC domain-containing protein [Vibrio parahaemolyticus]EHA6976912.1 VRR-NUC domain-containing protein [Vibrio parahaemolyticus]HCG7995075.1 VRR-NUC domain-containing protein [Vibrio parahaemolyticus]
MKKLTTNMNRSILELYHKESDAIVNRSTLKALKERNLLGSDYCLNHAGKNYAISKMPLKKQCSEMSLELEIVNLHYTEKPEIALLNNYKSVGYVGSSLEGIGMFTVLKALMLDKLAEHNIYQSRADACGRYLEAQLTILEDRAEEIIWSMADVNEKRYVANFNEIITTPFIAHEYPELSLEFGLAIFRAIDVSTFISLAKLIVTEPYSYRSGWPDLTLIKNDTVLFVEVKTSDKLHASQIATIPAIRNILPYEFKVVKISRNSR